MTRVTSHYPLILIPFSPGVIADHHQLPVSLWWHSSYPTSQYPHLRCRWTWSLDRYDGDGATSSDVTSAMSPSVIGSLPVSFSTFYLASPMDTLGHVSSDRKLCTFQVRVWDWSLTRKTRRGFKIHQSCCVSRFVEVMHNSIK